MCLKRGSFSIPADAMATVTTLIPGSKVYDNNYYEDNE